jgi:hypothetical protein
MTFPDKMAAGWPLLVVWLVSSTAALSLTFPTSGAVLFAGRTYNVTWTPRILGDMVLSLAIEGGPFPPPASYDGQEAVFSETVRGNTGFYAWTVRTCKSRTRREGI